MRLFNSTDGSGELSMHSSAAVCKQRVATWQCLQLHPLLRAQAGVDTQ